jgi:hypothetical protein
MPVITKEIWSYRSELAGGELLGGPVPIDNADTMEAGLAAAASRASQFAHHGLEQDASFQYYWGRNEDAAFMWRFAVRP